MITLNNTFFEENEDNIAVETGAENNVLVMTGSTSSRAAEDGVEIDGNNNRITVLNSSITENGTVAGDPNDGLDVDESGNLITVQQTIFDVNTEDGIDIEGANNRLTVDNSTFTNNGRVGLLRAGFQNSRARRPATRNMQALCSSDWTTKPSRS